MRTRVVAVVGSGKELAPAAAKAAEQLGAELARRGYAIVTGGLGGVMEAVARGAAEGRGRGRHPPILGVLPGYDPQDGNAFLDVVLPSGMGHARNALVASFGEALVCLGGATGALSEVALARKMGRPVLVFAESGGTAGLTARALPSVHVVRSPAEAVARLDELLG